MEIRIMNDDGEELWVKPHAAIMKTPSSPREEVFQRLAFALDWALLNRIKSTNTPTDDRSVIIYVSEATIEFQEEWPGWHIHIDLSCFTDEQLRKLKFKYSTNWVPQTFSTHPL